MNLKLFSILALVVLIYVALNISFLAQKSFSTGNITLPPIKNGFNSSKVIILAFDDSSRTQFELAKPVLDKYGYKGSFFTVCNFVIRGSEGVDKSRMTWQDIKVLQQQGHDIESHTMTHTDLNNKSPANLDYEIGASKQCLLNHGINSTVFAYPASTGGYNSTVVNTVAKYYNLARVGDAPLAFMHCNGYKKENDANCLPFNKNGTLKYENRYDIRNWSDRPKIEQSSSTSTNQVPVTMNNGQMFSQFIKEVNLQSLYNKNGCIQAIPIVVYHNFLVDNNHTYLSTDSFTDVNLFDYEMKYLHDNGFVVLKMSDLGFNPVSNYLYIKGPIVINTNNPTTISNVLLKNC
jgi:peptidoglycan/xylan/chitin deacetylase (PgdA/CDA1 family)